MSLRILKTLGLTPKASFPSGDTGTLPFKVMPPRPGVCPECGLDHAEEEPHDLLSFLYKYNFFSKHGRWPLWTDAMSHCLPEIRDLWRANLRAVLSEKGIPIPEDLEDRGDG